MQTLASHARAARLAQRCPGPAPDAGRMRRRHDLRLPRRRRAAALRRALRRAAPAPCAGAARAGGRPCGRGLCAQHRPRRRGAGDLGARRGQHHHRAARCDERFGAAAVHQRPGRDRGDRHRCLPGERCAGHVAARDQVEPPAARGRRDVRPRSAGRWRSPPAAGRGRCCSTCPRMCSWRCSGTRQPRRATARRYAQRRRCPAAAGQPAARGRPAVHRAPAGALRRRRPDQRRAGRLRGFHDAGAPARRALHPDADGPGRLSGLRPALSRHAGHARHAARPTWPCTRPTWWSASAPASTTA